MRTPIVITNKKTTLINYIQYQGLPHLRSYLSKIFRSYNNISWSKHIDIITCKTNSILVFLQRNLSQCSLRVKSLAYFTYVRPVLEYASVVWSPFTQSNIDKIEKVQCKAARFVFNDYYRYSSVTNMLNCLKWESLEHKSTIIMFYKIINNIVSADFSNYLHRSFTRTRGHQMRFMIILAKRNTYYHSFLPTAILLWNSLSEETVNSPNLHSFINLLSVR